MTAINLKRLSDDEMDELENEFSIKFNNVQISLDCETILKLNINGKITLHNLKEIIEMIERKW